MIRKWKSIYILADSFFFLSWYRFVGRIKVLKLSGLHLFPLSVFMIVWKTIVILILEKTLFVLEMKQRRNLIYCFASGKMFLKISAEKAFKKIMFCNMIARMKRLQGNFLFTWKEKIYQWFILFFESRILCFHYPFLSKHKESAFSKLTAFFKDKSKVKFILMPGYTGSFTWEFLTYKRAHYLNTSIQVFLTLSISLT